MATWDSADLLLLFNEKAGRPASGDAITDARKYARLSKSQNRVIAMMVAVVPNSLYPKVAYGSLPTLTTTDNQVYTFGTDSNGYAKFPMGKGGIYTSLNDIPNFPLVEGQDFITEGTQIRSLNNGVLPATLYWYGIAQPPDISSGGSAEPSLFPEASRELIVIDAVRQFAMEGNRNADLAASMAAEWGAAWPTWCLTWRTQFRKGGALNVFSGMQLAALGSWNAGL